MTLHDIVQQTDMAFHLTLVLQMRDYMLDRLDQDIANGLYPAVQTKKNEHIMDNTRYFHVSVIRNLAQDLVLKVSMKLFISCFKAMCI